METLIGPLSNLYHPSPESQGSRACTRPLYFERFPCHHRFTCQIERTTNMIMVAMISATTEKKRGPKCIQM